MALNLQEKFESLKSTIMESEAVEKLRAKWQELDPQSQTYLKWAGAAGVLLVFGGASFGTLVWVRGLKNDLNSKMEVLTLINAANQEFRNLQALTGDRAMGGKPNWKEVANSALSRASVDTASAQVGSEKDLKPGASSTETLFEVQLRRINIRKLVNVAHELENNSEQPVKIRAMQVETDGGEGHLNVKLFASGFAVKEEGAPAK
jgi:type II secretory pathway component PulM